MLIYLMHFFSFSFPVDNQRKVTSNEILVAVVFYPEQISNALICTMAPSLKNDPVLSHDLLRSTMLYETTKT